MADILAFEKELIALINHHSLEGLSNTPDFVLAQYLMACLFAWNGATNRREQWYGREPQPATGLAPLTKEETPDGK